MLFVGCLLVVLFVIMDNSHFTLLILALFILGLGLGPQLSVVTAAVQNSSPKDKIGLITGALTTTRQLGGIIGLSFLNLLFYENTSPISQNQKKYGLDHHGTLTTSVDALAFNNSSVSTSPIVETFKTGTIWVFLIMSLITIIIFALNSLIKEVPLRDN